MRFFIYALLLLITSAVAQIPPQPDPTVALLMAQPQIDTTTPVAATASFDPPLIRPGESVTYRVTFNALMDSIQWPDDIIAPQQLDLKATARGQMLSSVGITLQPRTTFNARARVTAEGTFSVPRFMVYVYGKPVTVPEARLNVTATPSAASAPALRLLLEVKATNLFVGQPFNARVIAPGTEGGIVRILTQVQFNGAGFLVDQTSARQRVEVLKEHGNAPVYTYEVTLTPTKSGPLALSAQGFSTGNQFSGQIIITASATIPGGPPLSILLDSAPVTVNVRPLPRENQLPGFVGAIGHFKLASPALATNVLCVGDPVTLTVNVHGDGPLARLVPPPPPSPTAGWRVLAGNLDNTPPPIIQTRGFVTFSFTLIPTAEETQATPVIPFSYFDPDKNDFVKLDIPSVVVKVRPSATPVDWQALTPMETAPPDSEKEPVLSRLVTRPGRTLPGLVPLQQRAWFTVLQIAPALLFLGLWQWDRRRRFFEQHPEILLRRRARRALHREWAALRKAAGLGDTPRFATCAVNAMRVACAPHYPAEPRALVSSDVLPLLAAADRTNRAGDTVRSIFAATDAERFAMQPQEIKDLLTLRPELERVLAQLEDRLR